ncbi:hypothetical protein [Coleofasciculus sp. E1-EBD-02]|uniref:hypothetical protein n=1 Tax=Coleofasciculus sp. E1-EBD-02 TaxID=3068481 RepID=UPI0033003BD2
MRPYNSHPPIKVCYASSAIAYSSAYPANHFPHLDYRDFPINVRGIARLDIVPP